MSTFAVAVSKILLLIQSVAQGAQFGRIRPLLVCSVESGPGCSEDSVVYQLFNGSDLTLQVGGRGPIERILEPVDFAGGSAVLLEFLKSALGEIVNAAPDGFIGKSHQPDRVVSHQCDGLILELRAICCLL